MTDRHVIRSRQVGRTLELETQIRDQLEGGANVVEHRGRFIAVRLGPAGHLMREVVGRGREPE